MGSVYARHPPPRAIVDIRRRVRWFDGARIERIDEYISRVSHRREDGSWSRAIFRRDPDAKPYWLA
jgi:hypothetical protein